MSTKVVVTSSATRGQTLIKELGLDPQDVYVVYSIYGALGLEKLSYTEEEILWDSVPHSFPDVVIRLVKKLRDQG